MSASEKAKDRYTALQINPFETSLYPQMQDTPKIGKKKGGGKRILFLPVFLSAQVFILKV